VQWEQNYISWMKRFNSYATPTVSNAGPEPLPEAGVQRTLEEDSSRLWIDK
jgi:hypothetical protein